MTRMSPARRLARIKVAIERFVFAPSDEAVSVPRWLWRIYRLASPPKRKRRAVRK